MLSDHHKQETTLLTRKPKEKSTGTVYNLFYVIKTFTRQIQVSEDIKHIKTIAIKCSSSYHSKDLLKHLKSSSLTYDKALIHFTEWRILPLISQVHSMDSQYSKITFVWPTEFQYKSSLQRAYDHPGTTVSQYRFLLLRVQPIILRKIAKVNNHSKSEESEIVTENLSVIQEEKKINLPDKREKGKSPQREIPLKKKTPKRLWGAACYKSPKTARSSLFKIPIEKRVEYYLVSECDYYKEEEKKERRKERKGAAEREKKRGCRKRRKEKKGLQIEESNKRGCRKWN